MKNRNCLSVGSLYRKKMISMNHPIDILKPFEKPSQKSQSQSESKKSDEDLQIKNKILKDVENYNLLIPGEEPKTESKTIEVDLLYSGRDVGSTSYASFMNLNRSFMNPKNLTGPLQKKTLIEFPKDKQEQHGFESLVLSLMRQIKKKKEMILELDEEFDELQRVTRRLNKKKTELEEELEASDI